MLSRTYQVTLFHQWDLQHAHFTPSSDLDIKQWGEVQETQPHANKGFKSVNQHLKLRNWMKACSWGSRSVTWEQYETSILPILLYSESSEASQFSLRTTLCRVCCNKSNRKRLRHYLMYYSLVMHL